MGIHSQEVYFSIQNHGILHQLCVLKSISEIILSHLEFLQQLLAIGEASINSLCILSLPLIPFYSQN